VSLVQISLVRENYCAVHCQSLSGLVTISDLRIARSENNESPSHGGAASTWRTARFLGITSNPDAEAAAGNDLDKLILAVHDGAVQAGCSTYADPLTGYLVFTSPALAARGRCCGNGCRHCPYPQTEQRRAGRPEETRGR